MKWAQRQYKNLRAAPDHCLMQLNKDDNDMIISTSKKNAGRKLMRDRHVVDDSFQGMLIFIQYSQTTSNIWKLHKHTLSTCSTSSQWTPSCSTAMDTSWWYDATTDELRNLDKTVALTRSSAVVSHACGGKFGLWSWNKTFKGFPKLKEFGKKKRALPYSTMKSWWKVWWNKYLNTYK